MPDLVFEPWTDPMGLWLCQNMRASDAAEIYAMRPEVDAYALYRDLASSAPLHLWLEVVRPADRLSPIAVFGVVPLSPGVGQAHMFGTDDLSLDVARAIAARIRGRVVPAMIEAGLHRVQAVSLAEYRWAHRFLRAAGARPEATLAAAGKRGEDFVQFIWLKGD